MWRCQQECEVREQFRAGTGKRPAHNCVFRHIAGTGAFFRPSRPAAAVEDCAASSQSVVAYETPLIVSRRLEDAVADVTSFEYRPRITGDARNRVGDVTRQISPALIKTAL